MIPFNSGTECVLTFQHRYENAGVHIITLSGLQHASNTAPHVGTPYSISYKLSVGGSRRVPTLGTIRMIDELNTPAMEWNPRLLHNGQTMFFLSERTSASRIHQATRATNDTWENTNLLPFAENPQGPISAFDITPDGRTIVVRCIGIFPPATKVAPKLFLATRTEATTGTFSTFTAIKLLSGSSPQKLRSTLNEWRQSRGIALSADGLDLILPAAALYAVADNPSVDIRFHAFRRQIDGVDFQLKSDLVQVDQRPRLMTLDGRYRVWNKPPSSENGPDDVLFACGDGPGSAQSVFIAGSPTPMEGRTTFVDFRTAIDQICDRHPKDSAKTPSASEVELGAIMPTASGFVFAASFTAGKGEMDLGWAPSGPVPESKSKRSR